MGGEVKGTTNHGGVTFSTEEAKQYGASKNRFGDIEFFIDLKNGVKVVYPQQDKKNNARVSIMNYGPNVSNTCVWNMQGDKTTVKIIDGDKNDTIKLFECSYVDVNTHTNRYNDRDEVIQEDCKHIYVWQ